MNLVEAFRAALSSLGEHKLRTTLTMLGMMFGVGAVIAMLSIGAGAEKRALAMIDRLGTHNVVVTGTVLKPEQLAEVRTKSLGLSLRDVLAIEEAVPGVAFAAPRSEIDVYKVIAAGTKTHARVFGAGARHREASPLDISEGRFFDANDQLHDAPVCVIGSGVRRDLFGADRALAADLKVNDLWCEVIGVLAPDPDTAHDIYLPYTTALAKLDRDPMKAPLGQIVVHLAPDVSAAETGAVIQTLLERLHSSADDYEILVPEVLLQHSRETRALFNLVMGLIAGISLVVGGVGIVNIMLATVLEQTREIGVRRAIGARRIDIQFQFLVTAFTLAMLGGVFGIALGVGIAKGVAAYATWPTVVTMTSVALSLGVSVGVGVAAGFYPALRAARLDPIQALGAP